MKRNWTTEELVEQWTLLPPELDLVSNKTGPPAWASPCCSSFLGSKPTSRTPKTRSPGLWSLTAPSR
jgi:hypothetical protein